MDLTKTFDTPDELAAFCLLNNEAQAAKLQALAEQGRTLENMQCTIPESKQ